MWTEPDAVAKHVRGEILDVLGVDFGAVPDERACLAASDAAARESAPWDEPHCGAGYRRHAVGVVVRTPDQL